MRLVIASENRYRDTNDEQRYKYLQIRKEIEYRRVEFLDIGWAGEYAEIALVYHSHPELPKKKLKEIL